MEHFNVLIATPGTNFDYRYIRSLMDTIEELNKKGITFKWLSGYAPLVNMAREKVISGDPVSLDYSQRKPLNGTVTYDKVFWIDSDMVWTPEDFLKLYHTDLEVVSGYCINYNANDQIVSNLVDQEFQMIYPTKDQKELIECGAVGFAFVTMQSGVFESIERPWFTVAQMRTKLEETGEPIFLTLGEDISWCMRAQEKGIKIYADPTVQIGHIKPRILMPPEDIYVQRIN